ncbi:hypothetical protein PIB30_069621 [Stylosanthes scabra]|uniref:Transposase MuDR plant domain-containing protein n=1 Tax=Stylosanthes scabra TaxID=79078 RepID=A0ABU6WMU7_9FABA|nr:hypothetical protein [Stylosanthes scabra]
MGDERSFLAFVHYTGNIKKISRVGIRFSSKESISVFLRSSTTPVELQNTILQKLGVASSKRVVKLFYKAPVVVVSEHVKYGSFVIHSNADLEVIFHCRRHFSEVRTTELYAKLEDSVASFGESNPIPTSIHIGGSSSLALVAPFVPVVPPCVASPSFATDLHHEEMMMGVIWGVEKSEPEGVEEALCDDEEDKEPEFIGGNSDDDHSSIPAERGGPSSSRSDQYSTHFSALDLEAWHHHGKRMIQYKGKESDHTMYHARCKIFGSRCEWLIHVALCTRKEFWEVRRYNGAYTCLATEVLSTQRQFDYHVICAFIMPMVRADAAVTIKVL